MILESDEREVKPWVPVEEEDQGQVHLGIIQRRRGHLTVLDALRLVEVKLRVQAPPLLVVLIDALSTDRQLDVGNGALGNPLSRRGAVIRDVSGSRRDHLEVHLTNEITVPGHGHGQTGPIAH